MKRIRIHNEIFFIWRFRTRTGDYNLEDADLSIIISGENSGNYYPDFTVERNTIFFKFPGKDQRMTGRYSLTMLQNRGKDNEVTIDKIEPFELVSRQENIMIDCEPSFNCGHLSVNTIELESTVDFGFGGKRPYLSLERLEKYLYRVTFDSLPEDNGGDSPAAAGCSSFVRDGKLFTNLDWGFTDTTSFIVRTREFEGQSMIDGLTDGNLEDALIAQLPYRIHRGINSHQIKVAAHVLYNDWGWTGCGEKNINITRLPFLILSKVKSMDSIAQDLDGVLDNLYAPEGLAALDYLLQVIVTDGTTTYAIMPPTSDNQAYILQDITSNPKLTNFRWESAASVIRTDLQERPTGVERWNAMPCDLKDLRFTKAYESPDRLSEFIGIERTTKDSGDAELTEIYNRARAEYLARQRDGKTWHTMESAIYGNKLESLFIQENWDKDCIGATDDLINALKRLPGYDPSAEQTLKNINGVMSWITE